jgi:hypothetical protein
VKIGLVFKITGWQCLTYEATSIEDALRQYHEGMGAPLDSEVEVENAEYDAEETALKGGAA